MSRTGKIIGGKRYNWWDWSNSKQTAELKAKKYRKEGYLARVIYDKESSQYHVYTKPKK